MSEPSVDDDYTEEDPSEILEDLLREVTEGLGLECEVVVVQEDGSSGAAWKAMMSAC